MEATKVSKITRVEPMADALGWIVFFDNNKYQQRVPAKYAVRPRKGDSITLIGFPQTRGVTINNRIVFMWDRQESNSWYETLYDSTNKVRQLEQLLAEIKPAQTI
jgi:hypothetical protein